MNEARLMVLVLQDEISKTPPAVRDKVNAAAEKLRAVLAEYGDEGTVALTLVACEAEANR